MHSIHPINESLAEVEATSRKHLTYVYNFSEREYQLWNPGEYKIPDTFPAQKLLDIRKVVQIKHRKCPPAKHRGKYAIANILFFLSIIALSIFYFAKQIKESDTAEDKVQYITCLVLYSFIAVLSSIVLFLNRKMNFLKDLKHKETKL